jgi:hypothetical protein
LLWLFHVDEAASKNNRIVEAREEEFEAEPDVDDDDDNDDDDQQQENFDHDNDDIGSDSDDDNGSDNDAYVYDNNRYSYPKHFHDEERGNERFIDDDEEEEDSVDHEGAHEYDGEENNAEENERNINAFKNKLTKAEGHPQHHGKFLIF